MKLLQLELPAFGSFTDTTLDFSTLQPGFHLIYGANEAGKSTLRRALTYLLFGIPERTTDAHRHTTEQLLIGGRVSNDDGTELHCYRRKGRKNTLLDSNNNPLEESTLQSFLGNINETQFNALFCFDHEQLRQGGVDLLNNGGHLGESLFEAGTGTLKIHALLSDLDREAGELFKPRATKLKLNKVIRTYKTACQQVKDYSLSAQQWQKHAHLLEEAQAQYKQVTEDLQKWRAEKHRLTRIQRTQPLLQRYHTLRETLGGLETVLLLPDDAMTRRLDINNALNIAEVQETQALRTITELQKQLAEIHIAEDFLAQKATIDSFRERLGWHQKAARDLPGVRTERRTVETEAIEKLQRIYPQADLQHIPIPTDLQRERLKQLADKYPLLCEKHTSSVEQIEKLTQQLAQYQKTRAQLPPLPDLSELKALLTHAIKHGDLEDNLLIEERELQILTTKVELGLKQLGLWREGIDALEHATLPSHEIIERFDRRFKEIETDQQRIKERVTQARDRYNRATERINALRWTGEIPTEEHLIQARYTRQLHWEKLKNARNHSADLIKTVEDAILKADEIADRLRREAGRVAEQANLLAEQQSAQLDYEQHLKKWHLTKQLLTELQAEWETVWQLSKIKPWAPAEMRIWLHECINLRQQMVQIRERRQRLAAQQQLISALNKELRQTLMQLGEVTPFSRLSDLVEHTQAYIAEKLTIQRQRETLDNQIRETTQDLQQVTHNQQKTTQAVAEWQTDWEAAISPLQLPNDTPPEIARNLLDTLDQVLNKADKARGLRRREERMDEDARQFQQEVEQVTQKLMPDLTGESVEQTVPILFNRLNQTEKDFARQEQLLERLHIEQHRFQQAGEQVRLARAHLQALLNQAHCDTLKALEIAEQKSAQKKSLQQQLIEVEQQLLEQGEGLSVSELAEAVKEIDRDQLPNWLVQLEEQTTALEQTRSELDRTIGEQQILLKQMDGNASAAQAADEAQSALAEIQVLSERYMELHLASVVLRQAIERYREQYQEPLIQRASQLFSRLTLESFCGLKIGYQDTDDQPILLGLRNAHSQGMPTAGMSDGTHDQLYLALRLASIEQYMAKSLSLPLIVDDILINFDDARSQATLSVLSELSESIQILFFTHHLHLVKLAQQAIAHERLKIHQL